MKGWWFSGRNEIFKSVRIGSWLDVWIKAEKRVKSSVSIKSWMYPFCMWKSQYHECQLINTFVFFHSLKIFPKTIKIKLYYLIIITFNWFLLRNHAKIMSCYFKFHTLNFCATSFFSPIRLMALMQIMNMKKSHLKG